MVTLVPGAGYGAVMGWGVTTAFQPVVVRCVGTSRLGFETLSPLATPPPFPVSRCPWGVGAAGSPSLGVHGW